MKPPLHHILALALLASANSPAQSSDYSEVVRIAKAQTVRDFKDPETVRFRDLFISAYAGTTVLCGQLNGRNSFGGYVGYLRFYAVSNGLGQAIEPTDSIQSKAIFDGNWQGYCTRKVADVE